MTTVSAKHTSSHSLYCKSKPKCFNLVITTSKEIKIVVNQCKHCRLRHASLLLAADSNTRWCQYWYFYYLCFAFDAIYSSFFRFYVLDQYLNGTFLFLLITQNLFLRFFPPFNASSHCPRTTNQINTDAAQKINACHSICRYQSTKAEKQSNAVIK